MDDYNMVKGIDVFDLIVTALIVLKILGYLSAWWVCFLPYIIKIIVGVIVAIIIDAMGL